MRIPTYEQQAKYQPNQINKFSITEQTPDTRLQISPEMFGGVQAKALGQASHDLQRAGALGMRAYAEWEDTKATAAFNGMQTSLNDTLYGPEGIFNLKGESAIDAPAKAQKAIAEAAREYQQKAGGSLGQGYFKMREERYTQQLMPRAMQHATVEKNNFEVATYSAAASNAMDSAIKNASDPEAFSSFAAEVLQNTTLMAQKKGLPPEAVENMRREAMSQTHMGVASGLLSSGDVRGAQGIFDKGFLTGQDGIRLKGAIRTEKKRLEAEAREARITARIDLGQRVQDASASYQAGADYKNPPKMDEFIAVYGEKQGSTLYRDFEEKRALGEDVQNLHTMTPEEQYTLLESRKPEEGEGFASRYVNYNALQKAVKHDADIRTKDPVFYLVNYAPAVNSARSTMLTSMTPENVNGYITAVQSSMEARGMEGTFKNSLPLLTATDARKIAADLTSSPEPEKMLTHLQQSFGKHWPTLERQLTVGENLPPDTAVVAAGMSGRPARLLLEAGKNKDFTSAAKTAIGPDYKTMQESLGSELQAAMETFRAAGATVLETQVRTSTEKLAATYMWQDGMSAKVAARKATQDVIGERYAFKGTYRVPKSMDTDLIDLGAKKEIVDIANNTANLSVPKLPGISAEASASRYGSSLSRNANWVTNEDESGLVLFVGGIPVRTADGSMVVRTWEELRNAAPEQDEISPTARLAMEWESQ